MKLWPKILIEYILSIMLIAIGVGCIRHVYTGYDCYNGDIAAIAIGGIGLVCTFVGLFNLFYRP